MKLYLVNNGCIADNPSAQNSELYDSFEAEQMVWHFIGRRLPTGTGIASSNALTARVQQCFVGAFCYPDKVSGPDGFRVI